MKKQTDKYDILKIENQLCFPLYACSKEVTRQYRKPLEKFNLTYTQYVVMMVLWEYGSMTEKELGERVYLESGTLAPLLKRLEKQGYISRIRPKENERCLMISLTDEGAMLKEKALEIPTAMNGCIDLSNDELMQLKKLLDKALSKMNR